MGRFTLLAPRGDLLPHFGSLGIIGVVVEEILQIVGRRAFVAFAQVDLRQEKLRLGEVRWIEPAGRFEVLSRQVVAAQVEVGEAELRVRQSIVGARQHGVNVAVDGFVVLAQLISTPPRLTSGSKASGSAARAARKHSSARSDGAPCKPGFPVRSRRR